MNNTRSIQPVNHRRQYLYESLQEAVLEQAGVNCRIVVNGDSISIRTKDYTDYCLAKTIVKQRTGKEVKRDQETLT